MSDELINHMVDRFLGWKLPENFHPDAGVTFDPVFNGGRGRHEPSGTNLFDAQQAEAMVRYMLEGAPDTISASTSPKAGVIPGTIESRLKAAAFGHPYAKIAWPHRLLHEAVAELDARAKRIRELEGG